jgi:2-oxoglutarate dehydrogenase E2 component (dihydrolipoamide succinyltransferase)
MARIELIMPKLGESVMEATILSWEKKIGDEIALDENVLTIATDKVDTEVPSPVVGKLAEILFPEGSVVPIGTAIAVIETAANAAVKSSPAVANATPVATEKAENITVNNTANNTENNAVLEGEISRFYSPLVKSIAKEEGVSLQELEQVAGTGLNNRLTKDDLLQYLQSRKNAPVVATNVVQVAAPVAVKTVTSSSNTGNYVAPTFNIPPIDKSNVEIIEMDRMRRLIADHMVMSKHVSPHVASFVEVDVTNMVQWREKNKKAFEQKYGEKITFTPLFIEAIVRALQDFPMVNISVEGTTIIRHKSFNIGMATALPTGNLIVPVIKSAETLNLIGLTKQVNDLANRARISKLRPDEVQGGTFTVTNVGGTGSVMGLPIINQPQAAILALGAIRKKPAVIETEFGDLIAVRQMMFLSLSYDHRVVDGMLGGSFLRKVGDYLEAFDKERVV